MQVSHPARAFVILILLTLTLAGCSTDPRIAEREKWQKNPDIARAARLADNADFLGASRLYRQLADQAPASLKHDYLLLAADNALSGSDIDNARAIVTLLGLEQLSGIPARHQQILRAELLLHEKIGDEALALLQMSDAQKLPVWLQKRYYQAQARAFMLTGKPEQSARALQSLDQLTGDLAQRLAIQQDILRRLSLLDIEALQLQDSNNQPELGWKLLALVFRQAGYDQEALRQAYSNWKQSNPGHPALPELIEHHLQMLASQYREARHIAVLLPQSGTYSKAAAALRDGIIAAWFQQSVEQRPVLRFYDSSNPESVWPLYTQAVEQGADTVIGPLQKPAVAQMVRAGELPIPVLALNQITLDQAPPADLYQYSLAPEDEIQQIAERAWLDGKRRPVLLVPADTWGERLGNAFSESWQALGGRVAGLQQYDPESHDFSQPILQLMQLDQSIARNREIERILGTKVEFTPYRRSDADFVVMVARPRQARQIKPQLQFYYAGDLPVYATSHVWSGSITKQQAPDLAGIQLPDIPWLLTDDSYDALSRNNLANTLPASNGAYGRIYAMGIDSYQLLPHLLRLRGNSLESQDGYTGNLYMDAGNHIHRRLVWVKLGETPEVLGYTPRLDLAVPDTLTAPVPELQTISVKGTGG